MDAVCHLFYLFSVENFGHDWNLLSFAAVTNRGTVVSESKTNKKIIDFLSRGLYHETNQKAAGLSWVCNHHHLCLSRGHLLM